MLFELISYFIVVSDISVFVSYTLQYRVIWKSVSGSAVMLNVLM
jgi:hypothetical protein